MTLSVAHTEAIAPPARAQLALWVGAGVYALLLISGNRLLNDPDTLWQVTIGQWIIDHRAVPTVDVYSFTMRGAPWISTQWLAQVAYAAAYRLAGWTGPVVLAASAIALSFALFARMLSRHLRDSTTLLFVVAAFLLCLPHLLARPHVLAFPLLVAWMAGLIEAADRKQAPPPALAILIALWANLHGGFVFGLFFIAPAALDAVVNAEATARRGLALRWGLFAALALAASCCTPYGWNALLAAQKILSLGQALPLIVEWKATDFQSLGPFEICLLLAVGFALFHGLRLPPVRILMLLGLLHMALAQARAAELLALVGPLVIAAPLAQQLGLALAPPAGARALLASAVVLTLSAGTLASASMLDFAPNMRGTPVAAVTELKTLNLTRVLNDYDFGGYLISTGVAPFIDGRTELYGEKFFVDHNAASGLMEPDNLFRLLKDHDIEATLLRTQSAATKLLDHVDGWQKVYADDIATIHLRRAGARHSVEPAVAPDRN
ncbi:hypothetical protein SSBR45G_30900 [Bradyrhizobium sp. SSBR45G]|uniref:hypothetical protein n=1 Tax=unclassified Bradyrhizobium TaxID=2631580 RepID=UPI0023429F38|nr:MULTISPECIES: hypothetical protein [unclassified Bradyrhizobium]GLH78181.1 hypothetical protein SSBR45G_30900 [Bradyrhizobium sp. SSBR45G]GLH86052.1 hypothetical protein SSBR45R_35120 [Bradyrhizobium sp. SSBR45R]